MPDQYGTGKRWSVFILVVSQITALSLWFISSAILPDILAETAISRTQQAALNSAVSAGFVVGALASAIMGLPDRFDPRRLFALCAGIAALSGFALLVLDPASPSAVGARFVTGLMLAGVYPVGMKMAVGWGQSDRGFLVGLLVGALTFGSASPHLVAWLGGADWRSSVTAASTVTLVSAVLILFCKLGPFYAKAQVFKPSAIFIAWTNKRVRYAFLGYFGHMWELYAMWSWIGVITLISYSATLAEPEAISLSKLTAFLAIAAGGAASIAGGYAADRIGKARITIIAMAISGAAALATAATFGGPVWITFLIVLVWGAAIVPDSPQFSALVADGSPPEVAGSLLTFQTAIGFALTIFTVQAAPYVAAVTGWPFLIAVLALGPALGIYFMRKLEKLDS